MDAIIIFPEKKIPRTERQEIHRLKGPKQRRNTDIVWINLLKKISRNKLIYKFLTCNKHSSAGYQKKDDLFNK